MNIMLFAGRCIKILKGNEGDFSNRYYERDTLFKFHALKYRPPFLISCIMNYELPIS